MVEKKEWLEFRSTGLLLFINQILHVFGWAIVFIIEDNKILDVYPARVKFRGFNNEDVSESYTKIAKYMHKNAKELLKESQE